MLLTTVILVLRETLEATLIVSVLLAWSVLHGRGRGWAGVALLLGVAGAGLYAACAATVSEWFDFVGMEIVNAAMHFTICAALVVLAARPEARVTGMCSMLLAGALAVVREGFEIVLYLWGFVADHGAWAVVSLGSALGAGIGIATGVLLFYLLVGMRRSRAWRLAQVLIALFAGNMAAQGVLLLIQADWVSGGMPLWNTSRLLAEDGVVGQLLYALIGYEATPSAWQAGAYAAVFCLVLWLFRYYPVRTDAAGSGN